MTTNSGDAIPIVNHDSMELHLPVQSVTITTREHRDRERTVVGFISTYAISVCHH